MDTGVTEKEVAHEERDVLPHEHAEDAGRRHGAQRRRAKRQEADRNAVKTGSSSVCGEK